MLPGGPRLALGTRFAKLRSRPRISTSLSTGSARMSHPTIRPTDVARTLKRHPWQIVAPVVVFTLLALAYAQVRPTTWEASQALVVRDEAGDRLTRPGKFTLADEMKNSQETILALARSRSVLSAALAELGPPAGHETTSAWPSEQEIEDLQSKVKITPPKGAEFGKTEVFYLKVQDASQQCAVHLALAICGQLQNCFANLREAKARGTIDELSQSVNLAQRDLADATRALGKIEEQRRQRSRRIAHAQRAAIGR